MRELLKRFLKDPQFENHILFLKSIPLFQDLNEKELGRLFQCLYARVYEQEETLFSEGDAGRALFIVESGRIELFKKDSQEPRQKLTILKSGDFFGEMAILEELPRSASAMALEQSRIYLLYKNKLDSLLVDSPRIGVAILTRMSQLLSSRLRTTSEKLMHHARNTAA
ncbi:MAG: cyclic nucleotide-binding domain-containing protein [Elusimicrobia bacterium]|nr:cyclic nucleotide-binding domain-containing protein [Elusimicrobiota bacterium]